MIKDNKIINKEVIIKNVYFTVFDYSIFGRIKTLLTGNPSRRKIHVGFEISNTPFYQDKIIFVLRKGIKAKTLTQSKILKTNGNLNDSYLSSKRNYDNYILETLSKKYYFSLNQIHSNIESELQKEIDLKSDTIKSLMIKYQLTVNYIQETL